MSEGVRDKWTNKPRQQEWKRGEYRDRCWNGKFAPFNLQ